MIHREVSILIEYSTIHRALSLMIEDSKRAINMLAIVSTKFVDDDVCNVMDVQTS